MTTPLLPEHSASRMLADRQSEKLAARPPRIDAHLAAVQLASKWLRAVSRQPDWNVKGKWVNKLRRRVLQWLDAAPLGMDGPVLKTQGTWTGIEPLKLAQCVHNTIVTAPVFSPETPSGLTHVFLVWGDERGYNLQLITGEVER
jgi:hypothetical protein